MSKDKAPQQVRSWQQTGSVPAQGQQRTDAELAWRQTDAPQQKRIRAPWRWSRQAQVGVAGTLFLALTGLLFWISFWLLPPKHACLILLGAGYQDNLLVPQNVYGWQTLVDLSAVSHEANTSFIWGSERLRLYREPSVVTRADDWSKLADFQERTAIIYLALHGDADEKGAYLLPNDATAGSEPDNRVYLSALLERLKTIPERKNKLLLLDATGMEDNWTLGMLENEFVRALEKLEPQIEAIPNLVVVCASDVNQRSWVSRTWRQTIFGHFWIEGLKGAAMDADNDGRFNALELFDYVRPGVQRWVRDNRDALQTPVMFPGGAEGERRARGMDLTVVRSYQAPKLPDVPVEYPAEVSSAWQKYSSLAHDVPAPFTYSPSPWREYQQRLLRFEQLMRAGDLESATNQVNKLLNLEQEIRRYQKLTLNSMENTLAMPVVAGQVPQLADTRIADFNKLWDAAPTQFGKIWAKLRDGEGSRSSISILRIDMYELLLERLEKGSLADLAKAAQLLRVLDDPITPRPAEIQYLALLQRDMPPKAPAEYLALVQNSLHVRVLAERTALAYQPGIYSYSAEIWPWIQDTVTKGDEARRFGQDLMLASDAAQWKKAASYLNQAQSLYKQAGERASALRQALQVRNRVLAGLPYYSQWLARRPIGAAQTELEASFKETEQLWEETYRLCDMLHNVHVDWIDAPPPASPDNPRPRSLRGQVTFVSEAFDDVENFFLQYCRNLANVDLPSVWRDVDDALRVPFADFPLRQKLLATMRRTARRLEVESIGNSDQLPRPDYEAEKQRQIAFGRRQGRMALATLGKSWFNSVTMPVGATETFAQVGERLQTFSVMADWWTSLDQAGWQIGARWQQMPTRINQQLKAAQQAPLVQALEELQQADTLARTITADLGEELTGVPAEVYRRLMVERLLLMQAQRFLDDHYYSLNPSDEPYYRAAGALFVDDAQRLENRQTPRKDVASMRDKINQPGDLVFNGPGVFQWTTEPQVNLNYALQPGMGAWVPKGYPVVWVEPAEQIKAMTPPPGDRLVREVGEKAMTEPLACTVNSPDILAAEAKPPKTPTINPTAFNVHGLFRGQKITLETKINLFLLANNIWYQDSLPKQASVAVRSAAAIENQFGASTGTLAIVLDVSGSMGPPQGQEYGSTTKYLEATRALREVLGQLPKGSTVSIWVFGQAVGQGKTANPPEETIRRIQEPVKWDPKSTGQLDMVMKKVEYPALEPWNESPIMATMLRAKEDLIKAKGFKTLLVITDGMDNRFENDRQLNPKGLSIPAALRQSFPESAGIMVNVVGFKVVDAEEKKARAQFEAVTQLPIPGHYLSVDDVEQLDDTLRYAMGQQLHYWVDTAENVPVSGQPTDGLLVTPVGSNAQWFNPGLPPAIYKLRVLTDRRHAKEIYLGPGDLLLVDLIKSTTGLEFERSLYGLTDYPSKPNAEQEGWRLAVLQNQQLTGDAMQMLTVLEKSTNRREAVLQMLKPRMTWIELAPVEAQPGMQYAQRWGYMYGYPAPAWSISVPKWVQFAGEPARPKLKVWWNPDQETTISASLDRGADFQNIGGLAGKKVQVDGDMITIAAAALEDHYVTTAPGRNEKKSCLAVRIQHAPGKPVWVGMQGAKPAGAEHRFFTAPNQYTALFWFDGKIDPAKVLSRLNLYSLAVFKREAEQRKFVIEMDKLAPPSSGDIRPPAPVSLK